MDKTNSSPSLPERIIQQAESIRTKIKANQLNASEELSSALDDFVNTPEENVIKKIKELKKKYPDQYNEYMKLSEIEEKWTTVINEDEYVAKYHRDTEIAEALGTNSFYDEGKVIFTANYGNSKIFTSDGETFTDTGKSYSQINKCGEYYLGIQAKNEGNHMVEWPETYEVLDREGHEVLKAKWDVDYRSRHNLYRDQYKQGETKVLALYDEHMHKIADAIPAEDNFIGRKNGKLLFSKPSRVMDERQYLIINEWETRDGEYHATDKIQNEEVYQQYRKDTADEIEQYEARQKEKAKMTADFSITFQEDKWTSVEKIIDKEWNIVFSSDDELDYQITYPHDINKNNMRNNQERLNNGIFILCGIEKRENGLPKKDVFINAKTKKVLEFIGVAWGTYVNRKVVKHFTTGNDVELYDLEWNKLWLGGEYIANEHNY